MKVAVTSQGLDLNSQVDPRFGRAPCFVVVDMQTRAIANGITEKGDGRPTAKDHERR